MAENKQVSKDYSFKLIEIKKEDLAKKLNESLTTIDSMLNRIQLNILGNKKLFVENVNNPKSTMIVGTVTGIKVNGENDVTVNINVINSQVIETIDRELSIDPDNYRVEVIFDASTEVAKVIMFKLNTRANIENKIKQKNTNHKKRHFANNKK